MQHKSLPGWVDYETVRQAPPNKFTKRLRSPGPVFQPRAVRVSPLLLDGQLSNAAHSHPAIPLAKTSSDFNSSEDDSRIARRSSPLRHEDSMHRNLINIRRQESQGHRRSLSNQTISITNDCHSNEIMLKSSLSDQNLIFQNDNYSPATGQYQQSMIISRNDQGSSNILVSNETVGSSGNRVNSTRIETGNVGDENSSMICVRNASNARGDGANHSSVFYKRSRNAALPKIPTMLNYKESGPEQCGIKAHPSLPRRRPVVESSASLDGFQQAATTTRAAAVGTEFGRSQPKYVNEVLLPRGPSPMCPSSSYAAGACNLSGQSAATSTRAEARCKEVMRRSFVPIAAQDLVEYDSDAGWKRRSMPINILSSSSFEEAVKRESLPISKVSEETEARDKDSRNLVESMPKAAAAESSFLPYHKNVVPTVGGESGALQTSLEQARANVVKRSQTEKRQRRKSQSGHDVSGRDADLNFSEYVGRDNGQNKVPREAASFQLLQKTIMEDASRTKEVYNSADSIKNIIDEVRSELMAQPRKDSYLSDESPLNEPLKKSNYNKKDTRNKLSRNANGSNKAEMNVRPDADDEVSDDVFVSMPARERHASFSAKEKRVVYPKRRTSSLEDMAQFQKRLAQTNRCKSTEGSSRKTSSSVSINETPQVFTYDNGADSFATLRSIARPPNTNSSSSLNNGVSLLNTKPCRGSLKKSVASPSSKSSVPASPAKSHGKSKTDPAKSRKKSPKRGKKSVNSSDYDPRDRRRDGNGNERDSYRYRDRGDRDKGELSDREQKDSLNDSFNRSLSNTEGTPDDKIGKQTNNNN